MKTNEFSRFVRDLAASLNTTKILYAGCCYAEDLSGFSQGMDVSGITQDPRTLERIIERYPSFEFRQGSPLETPYAGGRFDFVFTHKFFSCLDDAHARKMTEEMYRISSRYIASFEVPFEKEGTVEDDEGRRGMYSRWLDFQVKIISNVQMHEEIDPERCRFTLVRKVR